MMRQFIKRETSMADKHMKKCIVSPATRKVQLGHGFIPNRSVKT